MDPGLWVGPGPGLSPDPSPIDGSGPKKSSSGRALDPGLRAGPGPGLSPDPSLLYDFVLGTYSLKGYIQYIEVHACPGADLIKLRFRE